MTQSDTNTSGDEAEKQFKEYVTSTAFSLTLTKHMCQLLLAIRDFPHDLHGRFSLFVPTVRRLTERGLVTHHWVKPDERPIGHQYYRLTTAGKHVCRLVELSGITLEIPAKRFEKRENAA